MPGTWDAETYLDRAQKWRTEADTLPPGKEHDACIVLAEGYSNLAELISRENDDRIGEDRVTGVARIWPQTRAFGQRCA